MDGWLIIWLIVGAALVVVELSTTTFVLLMVAFGAFAAAGAAALGANEAVQAIVFAVT
ncbi:NfeD family protein, partial [Dactylosporangium sp. NPDC005572]